MSDPTHRCQGCTNRWTGLSTAHCGACHITFSGVRIFDEHQTFKGTHMSCKPPLKLPGVIEVRPGVFGRPVPHICSTHEASETNV